MTLDKEATEEQPMNESRRGFLKGLALAGVSSMALSQGLLSPMTSVQGKEADEETPLAVDLPARTSTETVPVDFLGEAFVECTVRSGIKYWFVNPGTDWPSFVEAISKRHLQGKEWPKVITVPHEYTATCAAQAYAQVSGEVPLVGFHVTVGTYNAHAGIQNAYTARVPIVFFAGRRSVTKAGLPGSDQGPSGQEPRDQAAGVRDYVKWDYEIRYIDHIPAIVQRGVQIAQSPPSGPIYITIPTETALMTASEVTIPPQELFQPSIPPQGDSIAIQQAAELLLDAENPTIITRMLGKNPAAVNQLVRFAELLAIPVRGAVSEYLNFPTNHPLNASISLDDADVIFTIASPNPWSGRSTGLIPNPDARYINLDVEPLWVNGFPMAGLYPSDISIIGDPATTLPELYRVVSQMLYRDPRTWREIKSKIEERAASIKELHDRSRNSAYERALSEANNKPLSRNWIQYCIGQLLEETDITLSDYGWSGGGAAERTIPGTHFGTPPSASLGYAVGGALGAKLASPNSTVVAVQGDGSFMYGVPTAAFFAARRHNLPFLAVVFNNACWRAVWSTVRREYPTGYASQTNFSEVADLSPSPDFAKIVESVGGYGETVEDPGRVMGAVEDAFHAVRVENRSACLNFILQHLSG